MLELNIKEQEFYDEKTNRFFTIEAKTLKLEHSLASISEWESKWKRPFLKKEPMTDEQIRDYIRCMSLDKDINPNVFNFLPNEEINKICKYIEDPMTATWFNKEPGGSSRRIITSELLYYYMFALNIPIECQHWHLNRLITLIHVCEIEQRPSKKMSTKAILNQNKKLNAARRKGRR